MLLRDPVPLPDDAVDDVKAYLRIDIPDDDALIASLAATALTRAEGFCSQMLITRGVTERLAARSPDERTSWQMLGALPVHSIGQVNVVSLDGVSLPLSPTQFSVDIDGEARGWVRMTDPAILGRIDVFYTAGVAMGWDALPEAVRHGVIRLVAYYYTTRDAMVDSGPPAAVAVLLRPWRRMRLSSAVLT